MSEQLELWPEIHQVRPRRLGFSTPNQYVSYGWFTALRFNSHRARDRALGHRQLLSERDAARTDNWIYRPCWSEIRSSRGGIYIVQCDLANEIMSRNIPGVTRLRGPYVDLRWCW